MGLRSHRRFGPRRVDPAARSVAALIGAGRIAIGAAAFLAPRAGLRAAGFGAPGGEAAAIARLAGGRDIALGAAALASLDDRDRLRGISLLCAGVDAGDATALTLGVLRREGVDRAAALGVPSALAAALAGAWIARRLG